MLLAFKIERENGEKHKKKQQANYLLLCLVCAVQNSLREREDDQGNDGVSEFVVCCCRGINKQTNDTKYLCLSSFPFLFSFVLFVCCLLFVFFGTRFFFFFLGEERNKWFFFYHYLFIVLYCSFFFDNLIWFDLKFYIIISFLINHHNNKTTTIFSLQLNKILQHQSKWE